MKKIIRLFVAIFCLFFVLQAMPGSFLPVLRSGLQKAVRLGSDATILLAEQIDTLTGGTDPSGTGKNADKAAHEKTPGKADPGAEPVNAPGEERKTKSSEVPAEETPAAKGTGSSAEAEKGTGSSAEAEKGTGSSAAPEKETDSSAAPEKETGSSAAPAEETAPDKEPDRAFPLDETDVFYYYYTRISKEERLLYDAMLALAQAADVENGTEESRLISLNPSGEEFAESYTRAYNALISDHAELFWIAQGRARYECRYYVLPSFGGKYKVVLSLKTDAEDANARTVFSEEQRQLKEAADRLLEEVDFTQSEAAIALRIHDLLIDSAWYNVEAGTDDYAHTAYGALVEDSTGNPGGALCDGYALAYEYLLQRAGLTCTMVCGYAGASEEDSEKHAWNLVRLDDDWYEVDPTWDDLDFLLFPSEEGYDLLLEALSDEEYMQRIRHYMFNLTTEEISAFTPGDEYRYVSYRGWVTLLQPSVHIRFTAEESEQTRDYVTPLAPAAEGTWYTWEMLTGNE